MKANQLAYKAIYQPKAVVWHQVPTSRMTYQYFENRYFYQGVCNSYTNIRKLGGLPKKNYFQSLNESIKSPLRKIKKLIFSTDKPNQERQLLQNSLKQSLIAGINFHQNVIRKNPKLLDWILKADYWDYKLPVL